MKLKPEKSEKFRLKRWGGSRGGSGSSVEPVKLNVKKYSKHVEVTLEQLNHFKLPLKTLEIAFQRP